MSRQDRQGVRRPADLEQKYNFPKRFDEAMTAADNAQRATEALDEQLNQREVFSRLTNNGASQGLFMGDNGEIYINASYLVTGILKSLDNETFYLDLVKGVLKGKYTEFSMAGKTVEEITGETQKNANKYADTAAQKAVNGQTQQDVFNKLTNNGRSQGLFYRNGQLYINASYLVAGILKSLDGKTFYLDLDRGVLRANFTELSIAGKKAKWKDNKDGTFTLIAEE